MVTPETRYIAHIRSVDGCEQTVIQHNENVSALAQSIGTPYGIGALSALVGHHHDDGKNTQKYLDYIKAAEKGINVVRGSVIHSTYGALLVDQLAPFRRWMTGTTDASSGLDVPIVGNKPGRCSGVIARCGIPGMLMRAMKKGWSKR